jgi:hypothetical protein
VKELESMGLRRDDPRLQPVLQELTTLQRKVSTHRNTFPIHPAMHLKGCQIFYNKFSQHAFEN